MKRKFSEVLNIINGKNQKSVENPHGHYPIYGSGGIMGYADSYLCPGNTVIIGRKGNINKPIYVDKPFWNVDTAFGLQTNEDILLPKYLFYFCQRYNFEQHNKTVTIPSLTKSDLLEVEISVPELATQKQVCKELDTIEAIIFNRNIVLKKLDNLIKSRFIEMFGDPVNNPTYITTKSMTDICQIIDGDRGKNYPKAEDLQSSGYCLFLNAKNVTSTGFRFDECMFITKEKDEVMRKGKLQRGDIILTTRGTIGNLAIYVDDVPYDNMRINSGMVILRLNENEVNDVFFVKQFRMQLDNIIGRIVSGSAQPQLPISTMNRIKMLLPPVKQQKQFADFVALTDKSKLAVQQSINTLQTLKDKLMQDYFE